MGSTKTATTKTATKTADARVRGALHRAVIDRGADTCVYCATRKGRMTVDHVVPVAMGGTSVPGNLVCACVLCNSQKADWDLDQFVERLRRRAGMDPTAIVLRVVAQTARPLKLK